MNFEKILITFTLSLATVIGICWLAQILWAWVKWLKFKQSQEILPPPVATRNDYSQWEDIE